MKTKKLFAACSYLALSVFTGWSATVEDSVTVYVDARDYKLVVESDYGAPSPQKGTNVYAWGSAVTGSVARTATDVNGINYACTGWVGTGAVPATGQTNVTQAITFGNGVLNSSLTWAWRLGDLLVAVRNVGGLVSSNLHGTVTVRKTLNGNPTGEQKTGDVNWQTEWEMPETGESAGFRAYYSGVNGFEGSPTAELWAEGVFTNTPAGGNTLTLVRNMPYATGLELVRASDGQEIPTNAVFATAAVNEFRFRVTVRNGTDAAKQVRVTVAMGEGIRGVSRYSHEMTTSIGANGTATLEHTFSADQISASGSDKCFYKSVKVEMMTATGGWQKTDAWDWVPAFRLIDLNHVESADPVTFGSMKWKLDNANDIGAGVWQENIEQSGGIILRAKPGGIGSQLSTVYDDFKYATVSADIAFLPEPTETSEFGFFLLSDTGKRAGLRMSSTNSGVVTFVCFNDPLEELTYDHHVDTAALRTYTFDLTYQEGEIRMRCYVGDPFDESNHIHTFVSMSGSGYVSGSSLFMQMTSEAMADGPAHALVAGVGVMTYKSAVDTNLPFLSSNKAVRESSVFKVVVGGTNGTGFFLNQLGSALTCWHVLEDDQSVWNSSSVLPDLPRLQGGVFHASGGGRINENKKDYTAYTPKGAADGLKRIGGEPWFNIQHGVSVLPGQKIYVVGYPGVYDDLQVIEGWVTSLSPHADYVHVTCTVISGNSGGPVFNEAGNMIGVMTSAKGKDDLGSYFLKIGSVLPDIGHIFPRETASGQAAVTYNDASTGGKSVAIASRAPSGGAALIVSGGSEFHEVALSEVEPAGEPLALQIMPDPVAMGGTEVFFDPPAILRIDWSPELAGIGTTGIVFQKNPDGSWTSLQTHYHDNGTPDDPLDDYWTVVVSYLSEYVLVAPDFLGQDTDGDGIPDSWEERYFGSATGAVAHQVYNSSGLTAWEAYVAGVNPVAPDAQGFRMLPVADPLTTGGEGLTISVPTLLGRLYTVQTNATITTGGWAEMVSFAGTGEEEVLVLPVGAGSCFYRLHVGLDREITPAIPSDQVVIPGGTNSGTDPDFGAYSLTVSPFYMDKYEVTKAKWDEVYTWAVANGYSFDNAGSGKAADHPVHTVNWYDCVKWLNARSEKEGRSPCYAVGGSIYKSGQSAPDCNFDANGYRLPTITEWEYAARGGLSGKRFPWGDTIQHGQANYYSSSSYSYDVSSTRGYYPTYATGGVPYTSPAGSFAANGYGLYDMAGNVWEWCNDASGSYRYFRGGCWSNYATFARCGYSTWYYPDYASRFYGFRAVCR